jgi:hypothetical protein
LRQNPLNGTFFFFPTFFRATIFRRVAVFGSRAPCQFQPTLPASSATRKRSLLDQASISFPTCGAQEWLMDNLRLAVRQLFS